jgi:hypothetical protein
MKVKVKAKRNKFALCGLGLQVFSEPVTWNPKLKTFLILSQGTGDDNLELMISLKVTKTMVGIVGASGRTPLFGRAAARPYNARRAKSWE